MTRFVDASTTGNGTLFITWQAPDSDGGSAITGYTVQWKSGSQIFGGDPSREHTTGDSVPDYLITGLTNGTEYTVRVIAVNAVGDGPPSDTDHRHPRRPAGRAAQRAGGVGPPAADGELGRTQRRRQRHHRVHPAMEVRRRQRLHFVPAEDDHRDAPGRVTDTFTGL